eukprot:CAMPEP_0170553116 /NCGR_PEP_ID=MMETSP0211-20121228/10955_1 /TAXON_ID=311385 /ORGANISM="Pseudokeronopsis sp., Strain OXSARD2" /LENGTH=80 /DNA_ID=CAMNT_0010861251 /DNA_START=136 /DNA_END=377 /DNA_ORIENTATION=+
MAEHHSLKSKMRTTPLSIWGINSTAKPLSTLPFNSGPAHFSVVPSNNFFNIPLNNDDQLDYDDEEDEDYMGLEEEKHEAD